MLRAIIGRKLGCKRLRNKKISELFREKEATGAILQFPMDTDVGRIKKGAFKISHTRLGQRRGDGDKLEGTEEGERIS